MMSIFDLKRPNVVTRFRRLPIILQQEIGECALACIAMIAQFFGHQIGLSNLRRLSSSVHGMTLKDMMSICEQIGLQTRAVRVSLSDLKWITSPVILHWNLNHFVVLKKMTRKGAIIHDPASGVQTYDWKTISNSYTGVLLEIQPTSQFKPLLDKHRLRFIDFMQAFSHRFCWIALIVVLSFIVESLGLCHPLLIQYATDHVLGTQQASQLSLLAVGFILITLLHAWTDFLRNHIVLYLTTHLNAFFSSQTLRHLLQLPIQFFESRHKGDLQSKFQSLEEIQKKLCSDLVTTILDGLMILTNFMLMLIYSPLLTSLVVIAFTCFLGLRSISFSSLRKQSAKLIHSQSQSASIFLETLHAIMPIKLFSKESTIFRTWHNRYIDSLNAHVKQSQWEMVYRSANDIIFGLEHTIVICIGANLVLKNQFSIGMLLAFLAYRSAFVNKFSSFTQHLFEYKLAGIQLERLSDILLTPVEPTVPTNIRLKTIRGELTLCNLSFQYDKTHSPLFTQFNLSISEGEKIVITGPSGCGKSTLLKIMLGLLKQTSGELYVDGLPFNNIARSDYRRLTAAVMQNDQLLSGSILENITFFDEEYNLVAAHEAARQACIHETICKFPMRYDTQIGEMGSLLSGGQKQRILLARALYRQPKILFLDEASSHLDVEHEKAINFALRELQMTQVMIAHREETIKMADRVIILGSS